MTQRTRTYRLTMTRRASRDFGAVRTVDTDVVTELETGGIRVDTHVVGHVEGARVDRRVSHVYPNVTIEAAHAYRVKVGYTEVMS